MRMSCELRKSQLHQCYSSIIYLVLLSAVKVAFSITLNERVHYRVGQARVL